MTSKGAGQGFVPELESTLVDRRAFLKAYREGAGLLARNLERLLENPREEEVHDARTATRRAEARIALLPRRLRSKGKFREIEARCRRVMEKSARLRDMDVIRGKLEERGGAQARLADAIADERKRAYRVARRAVSSAAELRLPSLSEADLPRATLQRRFEKVVKKLTKDIDEQLPTVLKDPEDAKALHRLRIDCKKLRYSLEAGQAEGTPAAKRAQAWQEMLGSIHDWDVAIAYVGSIDAQNHVLKEWGERRKGEFGAFARSVRKS